MGCFATPKEVIVETKFFDEEPNNVWFTYSFNYKEGTFKYEDYAEHVTDAIYAISMKNIACVEMEDDQISISTHANTGMNVSNALSKASDILSLFV